MWWNDTWTMLSALLSIGLYIYRPECLPACMSIFPSAHLSHAANSVIEYWRMANTVIEVTHRDTLDY
jgi:hypothetical protein